MEAESATFASGKLPKTTVDGLPGFRVLPPHKKGDYLYFDANISSPSRRRFAGIKLVCWRGIPGWVMQYHGFWRCAEREEITLFLREALRHPQSPGKPTFTGWRGPTIYRKGSLVYHNMIRRNEPDHIHGEEAIFDTSKKEGGVVLFDSEYTGFSLFSL